MIPTSIDGTDITGATIDGTDVQEITVDGDVVFSANTFIDDFEDGNLNEYSNDVSDWQVQSTTTFSGTGALTNLGNNDEIYSLPGDGLDNYPQPDDTLSIRVRLEPGAETFAQVFFGANSRTTSTVDTYIISVGFNRANNNYLFRLSKVVNGDFVNNQTILFDNALGNLPEGEFLRIEWDWGSNGLIDATLFDESGSLIISDSATDTDNTSGGIGFRAFRSAIYDNYEIL